MRFSNYIHVICILFAVPKYLIRLPNVTITPLSAPIAFSIFNTYSSDRWTKSFTSVARFKIKINEIGFHLIYSQLSRRRHSNPWIIIGWSRHISIASLRFIYVRTPFVTNRYFRRVNLLKERCIIWIRSCRTAHVHLSNLSINLCAAQLKDPGALWSSCRLKTFYVFVESGRSVYKIFDIMNLRRNNLSCLLLSAGMVVAVARIR